MDLFIGCEADDLESKKPRGPDRLPQHSLFYLKRGFSCHYAGIFLRAKAAIRDEQADLGHRRALRRAERCIHPRGGSVTA